MKCPANTLAMLMSALWIVVPAAAHAQEQPPADDASTAFDDQPAPPLPFPEPDWSLLDTDGTMTEQLALKKRNRPALPDNSASWSTQSKANGSALSVKQSLSPFWDARIGADMTVVNQPTVSTTSDLLRQQFSADGQTSQSNASAWAAVTAPGVGSIWDKTAIEARVDPVQDQSKLGTSLSKTVPLWSQQYLLTLQNGYNVVQQNIVPALTLNGRPVRSYETEQLAKFSITDTGTSFVAGQSLSSSDEKWLRKVGAEQKLFGDVNIAASISETLQGPANKSLTAGFKHSW